LHNELQRADVMNEQMVQRHLGSQCFGFNDLLDSLVECMVPQDKRFAGRMVLLKGQPCSGKTHLLCQAIQRLRSETPGPNNPFGHSKLVFLRQGLDTQEPHWNVQASTCMKDEASMHEQHDVYISVNFMHDLINTRTLHELLLRFAMELQTVGLARTETLAPQLAALKLQLRDWLRHATQRAHIIWIIDGLMNPAKGDYEYLQTLSEDEGSLTIIVTHDSEDIPVRLAKFCDPTIDMENSESLLTSVKTVIATYLSSKSQDALCEPVTNLLLNPAPAQVASEPFSRAASMSGGPARTTSSSTQAELVAESLKPTIQMTPGRLRLLLDWSLFHAHSVFETSSLSIRKSLSSTDPNDVMQAFLKDVDDKYRSYGDCLRFFAIARPGLTEYEMVALLKARNSNSTMDSARFSRFRAEMFDRRIILVLGGVFDFTSVGVRNAAHVALFTDNKQRLLYMKVMLEWLKGRSRRSPRRMVLLGQLCLEMIYFSRLPWLPETSSKSLLLFQMVAGGVEKKSNKPKPWGLCVCASHVRARARYSLALSLSCTILTRHTWASTHAHTLTPTQTHTHANTHTLIQAHTHTHTLSLPLFFSLTPTRSLSLTHTQRACVRTLSLSPLPHLYPPYHTHSLLYTRAPRYTLSLCFTLALNLALFFPPSLFRSLFLSFFVFLSLSHTISISLSLARTHAHRS